MIDWAKVTGKLQFQYAREEFKFTIAEKMRQELRRELQENQGWTAFPSHHNDSWINSGFLRFKIDTYSPGSGPIEWVETDKTNKDGLIPIFLERLVECAKSIRVWQQELQDKLVASERKRQEQERLLQIAEADAAKWQAFRQAGADWKEAQDLRKFAATIKDLSEETAFDLGGMSIDEWLIWVEKQIAKLDPLYAKK